MVAGRRRAMDATDSCKTRVHEDFKTMVDISRTKIKLVRHLI